MSSTHARVNRSQTGRRHGILRFAVAGLGVSGAWFLITSRSDLVRAVGSVASLSPATMPAGLALVALGVLNRGFQAQTAHRLLDVPARLGPMVELSASSYATNKVVKTAGTAGVLPFLADARRRGESSAKVGAAYVSMKLAESLSLCGLIALAVLASVATGALSGPVLYGAIASLAYALIVSAAILVFASNRRLAQTVGRRLRRVATFARARLRRPDPVAGPSVSHELVGVIGRLRAAPTSAAALFASAIISKLIGVACLALVFAGFGIEIGLVATVLVYMLTLMASMVGPLPGGIGVAEASLAGLLVARGISAPTVAGAIIAFRLLDLWLPLLAGVLGGVSHSRRVARERPAPISPPGDVPVATPVPA